MGESVLLLIPMKSANTTTASAAKWALTLFGLIAGTIGMVKHTRMTDFPIDMVIYREGVKAYIEGRSLYSEPMMAGDIALPFIYPPFGALAMVPLTAPDWITHDLAGDIMNVLSDLLLLVCLYFVFRAILKRQDLLLPVVALCWAATLAFEPIRLNNGFAQVNIVVMALVVLDLVPRKRFLPQGILIGLTAAIKITPLAMLLYFLLRKELKPIFVAIGTATAATLIAGAVRWQAFEEFFTSKLLDMGSGADFGVATDYQSNSSLKAVVQRLYTSTEAMENNSTLINLIWLVGSLAVVVIGARLILALIKRNMLVDAQLVTALVMLLISPVSWSHHWVWLALIIPVFTYRAWTWRNHTWVAGFLLAVMTAWIAMVVSVPPKWWFGDSIDVHSQPYYQKFLVDDFVWLTFIAVALFAYCLRYVAASPAISRRAAK